jgi:hypothetical protein
MKNYFIVFKFTLNKSYANAQDNFSEKNKFYAFQVLRFPEKKLSKQY